MLMPPVQDILAFNEGLVSTSWQTMTLVVLRVAACKQ
jgi:hypothetical protein